MEKRIIAALEIADHEVRLLVGQFFNGRLNILKVERVPHLGVNGYSIMSETHVVESIKKAIENASRNLGVVVSSVLLLVPGVHIKRVPRQLRVPITGRISELDIRRINKELSAMDHSSDTVLTNILFTKFFVNGSSTRKLPLNERCDSLTVEANCYYGKQSIIFPYVSCVEKAGLNIIDIVIDDIGLAKEASLFEASIDRPIIGLTMGEKIVRMSLYYQGSVMSSDYMDHGFEEFLKMLENQYKIPNDVARRLVYYNLDLTDDDPSDDPIFMWSTKSSTHDLSVKDVSDSLKEPIVTFVETIVDRCEPIFELGEPLFVMSGEASVIEGLETIIESRFEAQAKTYQSTTFGVKDPGLSSLVGAFYYYKDQAVYRDHSYSSVDEDEFNRNVLNLGDQDIKDESITQKLKNMFFERKQEE